MFLYKVTTKLIISKIIVYCMAINDTGQLYLELMTTFEKLSDAAIKTG